MNNGTKVDTNKNKNMVLKNFTEIKEKIENTMKDINYIYPLSNGRIKQNLDYVRNLLKIQLNITNDYIKKVEKINKDFDLLNDNYLKKISELKKFNIKSIAYK